MEGRSGTSVLLPNFGGSRYPVVGSVAGSSNGKTRGSGPRNWGSNPCPAAFVLQKLITFAVVLALAGAVGACGEDEESSSGSGAAPAETPPPPEETAAPADVEGLVAEIPENLEKKPGVPALAGDPPT